MLRLYAFLILSVLFAACANKYQRLASQYEIPIQKDQPDYSQLYYWAAHPWKKDPSDSIPLPLLDELRDSIADVFFIHPTTYTDKRMEWNADVNNAELNAKTDFTSILYQSSVFNQHCRVFAPRYRQGHYSAFFIDTSKSYRIFDTAYADVKNAFQYYLKHYHKNRPIIIAGHSQGAVMAERLIKEFFDGKELQSKLVVAYFIGWPIGRNIFKNVSVCTDSSQTGCFAGWRTLKKGYIPSYMKKEYPISYVTNPLSWDTTSNYVSAEFNKGSVLREFDKLVLNTTDAQIHEGVLWVNKPRFPGSFLYRARNYHIADINLYYINLRINIETRIRNFIKNDQASH